MPYSFLNRNENLIKTYFYAVISYLGNNFLIFRITVWLHNYYYRAVQGNYSIVLFADV